MRFGMKKITALVCSIALSLGAVVFSHVVLDVETTVKADNGYTMTADDVRSKIDAMVAQGRIGRNKGNMDLALANFSDRVNCNGFVRYLCREFTGISNLSIGTQETPYGPNSKCVLLGNDDHFIQIGKTLCNVSGSGCEKVTKENLEDLFKQAQCGDIVQMDYTKGAGSYDYHVLMVYSVSETGISFYHFYSYGYYDTNNNYHLYDEATIGGCALDTIWAQNNKYDLSIQITWDNLHSFFSDNSDDGISVYRLKYVAPEDYGAVKTSDEFIQKLNEASESGEMTTIKVGESLEIDLGSYSKQYPHIITKNADDDEWVLKIPSNVIVTENKNDKGKLYFSGKTKIVNYGDIRLGQRGANGQYQLDLFANNSTDSRVNESWFSGYSMKVVNYGRICNCACRSLNNTSGGWIGLFISFRDYDEEDDSSDVIVDEYLISNDGRIETLVGRNVIYDHHRDSQVTKQYLASDGFVFRQYDYSGVASVRNKGTITSLLHDCPVENYGLIEKYWALSTVGSSADRFDMGASSGSDFFQFDGETKLATDYNDNNSPAIYHFFGGNINTGAYQSIIGYGWISDVYASFSVTLNNLDWNEKTGARKYTTEQAAAIYELERIPGNYQKIEWYSTNGKGNVTYIFWTNDGSVKYQMFEQLMICVALKVADCFENYTFNILKDFDQNVITSLPNNKFKINLNWNKLWLSMEEEFSGHCELKNGMLQISKTLEVASPNTLVLNNISIDTKDFEGDKAFECNNGRIVFNDCSSVDNNPVVIGLSSQTDVVEINNSKAQKVEYLKDGAESSGQNSNFVIRMGENTNGVTSISEGTNTKIYSSLVNALLSANVGSYNLVSDANVENLVIPQGMTLVLNDDSTVSIGSSAQVDGEVSGQGTIDLDVGAGVTGEGTISSGVTVSETYKVDFDLGEYTWMSDYEAPTSTKGQLGLPVQENIFCEDSTLLSWKNKETGKKYAPGATVTIDKDTTFEAVWRMAQTPTPTKKATPTPTKKATPTPSKKATPTPTKKATPTPTKKVTPTPTKKATPTPVANKPAVPTNVKAVSETATSIKISWSAVSGATGYQVWRGTSANGTFTAIGSVTTTSRVSTGLTTGTKYYYKVRAYKEVNGQKIWGDYSAVVNAVPTVLKPTNVKAVSESATSIKVSWSAVSGASGYQVWRGTSADGTFTAIGTVTTTSRVSTGLTTGTKYYYKVRAYKEVNGTKCYGDYSAVVSAVPKLEVPSNVAATSESATSVKVSWSKVTGATGYQVWRSTSATGTFTAIGSVTTTSRVSTALTAGTTYYYKVRAYKDVNGTKVYGDYSSVVSAVPKPTAPANVKATVASATNIKVSWSKVTGATGYEVFRAESANGTYSKLGAVTTTERSCPGLTTGKTYYFKVRAYTEVNGKKVYSDYSTVISAVPKA